MRIILEKQIIPLPVKVSILKYRHNIHILLSANLSSYNLEFSELQWLTLPFFNPMWYLRDSVSTCIIEISFEFQR